jgi:serine phosphatase RsbU (regulator of sigma subunit)
MYQGLLRSIPLFSALPDEELRVLSQGLQRVTHPAGIHIFQEGEPNDRFSIVTQGEIEITRLVDDSTERVLQTLRPGDYYGEMSLLVADSKRSASGRARTEVQLLEMERRQFDTLLRRQPGVAVEIMRSVAERMRLTENAVIAELRASNRELVAAYSELQAAQARLIEQERTEYELSTARRVQERILPKTLPAVESWTLTSCWHPARSVGGDFYDCFAVDNDHIALIIGDVTGKGIPAALIMATTCSLVRFVGEQLQTPGAMLARINDRVVADMPEKMFVTCLIAVLEPATGHVRYANAGHNLPMVRGASGVRTLHARGMPLGLMAGMEYEENEDVIVPGELLMLYSDGIVEARNQRRELFGERRLAAFIAASPAQEDLTDVVCQEVWQFMGEGLQQEDDITMLVVERAP